MKRYFKLLAGEKPIENAPPIKLENGKSCIPQHYLLFEHTIESVEKIVVKMDFDDKYPIFVCEDQQGIYIQIGIVGFDNFQPRTEQVERKIVYGRKWRVEQQLPSSEIIQTAFLAIKTAREHEIRELFQLTVDERLTTPFNNHHDLPLMAMHSELISCVTCVNDLSVDELKSHLQNISYDYSTFELISATSVSASYCLVELLVEQSEFSELAEMKNKTLSFLVTELTLNQFMFGLMDALIAASNQFVEENFQYDGFARFSRNKSVTSIARLSSRIRKVDHLERKEAIFLENFKQSNYQTDLTRVPALTNGPLAHKIRSTLEKFNDLEGMLPK